MNCGLPSSGETLEVGSSASKVRRMCPGSKSKARREIWGVMSERSERQSHRQWYPCKNLFYGRLCYRYFIHDTHLILTKPQTVDTILVYSLQVREKHGSEKPLIQGHTSDKTVKPGYNHNDVTLGSSFLTVTFS